MTDVKKTDAEEGASDELPLLSWMCFLCGTTHISNVPVGTRGNQVTVVTCPETGEQRKVIAIPFYLLSRKG